MKKAAILLVLCCLLWGYSFPVMQLAMSSLRARYFEVGGSGQSVEVQELGLRGAFLGWRFGLAAVFALILLRATWGGYKKEDVRGGVILGTLFAAGMMCQLAGLQYTLPSVSSFLTSLTVIFTPLAQSLIFKRHVNGWTWAGVALGMAGACVLGIPNPEACTECSVMEKPPVPYLGEILTTIGALIFTAQILYLDKIGGKVNSQRMTMVNFVTTCLICSQIGIYICGRSLYRGEVAGRVLLDPRYAILLVTLTLFSSVVAVNIMNRYQHEVSPAVASVIYTSESIFALIFSLLFRTEKLTGTTIIGGTLILGALAAVTIPAAEQKE